MKLKSLLSISAALYLAMFSLARFGTAQVQEIKPEPPLVRQMLQEGWQKVAEGVLQRSGEEGLVETFTYGEEGLRWTARKLEARLAFLESEYKSHPSEQLAGIIENLKAELIDADQSLKNGSAQAEVPTGEELNDCTITYGAHAYASALTGSQAPGTAASADSNYSTNCGQLGNTYAYAYARATAGTVTTTKIQEDPKYDGTALSSAASASAPGDHDCYSEGYARAWSPVLNINYESYTNNYLCPNPPSPLSVTVDGPYDVYLDSYTPCQYVTWTASASGGTPGYTFDWYIGGTYQGSGSSLTKRYCRVNARVDVTATGHDSAGQSANGYFTTWISYEPSCTSACACATTPEDPYASSSQPNMPVCP